MEFTENLRRITKKLQFTNEVRANRSIRFSLVTDKVVDGFDAVGIQKPIFCSFLAEFSETGDCQHQKYWLKTSKNRFWRDSVCLNRASPAKTIDGADSCKSVGYFQNKVPDPQSEVNDEVGITVKTCSGGTDSLKRSFKPCFLNMSSHSAAAVDNIKLAEKHEKENQEIINVLYWRVCNTVGSYR